MTSGLKMVCLLHAGVPLTQRQLDDACEAHLQQRFGEKLDFAVENSLPFLIHDGLIKETGDVRNLLYMRYSQLGCKSPPCWLSVVFHSTDEQQFHTVTPSACLAVGPSA